MCFRLQSWWTKQRNRCYRVARRQEGTAPAKNDDYDNWQPGRHPHSIPRRLLCNFCCEPNISEQVEQVFLKQLLKEHGLYSKHQTLAQRRRLKQLLELEERTVRYRRAQGHDAPEPDMFSVLHSLTPQDTTTPNQSRSIELHSIPSRAECRGPIATVQPNNTIASRLVTSLPTIASAARVKDPPADGTMASQPNIAPDGQQMARETWERIVVWKTFVQGATLPHKETEV